MQTVSAARFGLMLGFDFPERFRWEIRGNNFDFNDNVNSLTNI